MAGHPALTDAVIARRSGASAGLARFEIFKSTALPKFDPLPLRAAVAGLYFEMQSQTAPVAVRHWVELIHTYVLRFAQPWQTD